jgi:dihydrofolate reductase
MRKVIVNEWMTLDGVVQAPGTADEDTTGSFEHGGWHLRYFDDISREWVVENLNEAGGFLLGRRTYEILAAYWPNAPEEEQVVARPLNMRPKYVASTTLTGPLAWQNSMVLEGDVAEAVAALKREDGADLHVIGSAKLVRTLVEHDLVDEFRLMIDPVVVGGECLLALAILATDETLSRGKQRYTSRITRLGYRVISEDAQQRHPAGRPVYVR